MKNTEEEEEDLVQAKLTILYALEYATESGISLRSDTLIPFCQFWAKHVYAIPDKRKWLKLAKEQLLQEGVIVAQGDSLDLGYCQERHSLYVDCLIAQALGF